MTDPSSFVSKPHSSGGGEGGTQPSLGPERLFGSMCGKDVSDTLIKKKLFSIILNNFMTFGKCPIT